MLIGYARVSTTDQSLEVQLTELESAGCERIFTDQATGTNANRPGLTELMTFIRDGDTLLVSRLDRFARSLTDLFRLLDQLTETGAHFRTIHQTIDTSSSTGKLTLAILGAVAEFENDIRRERQKAGIDRAKSLGIYTGRKPSIDTQRVRQLAETGMGPAAIARELGCHRQSVYRLLKMP